jgi:hypothetical protein
MNFGRRGNASLELVIALPLLFSFILASVDIFKAGHSWILLSKTVREAVRWASAQELGEPLLNIQAEAEDLGKRLGLEEIKVTVTGHSYDWSAAQGLEYNSAKLKQSYLQSGQWTHSISAHEPITVRGETRVSLGIGRLLFADGTFTVKATAVGYP